MHTVACDGGMKYAGGGDLNPLFACCGFGRVEGSPRSDKIGQGRFNRLPIEPRPDGSQPPRIYELALHGLVMSRPIQWLSRHLWGWILTILFVISGVIAIASILAWLMRIVWSQENLLSVQSQGFATDLHIVICIRHCEKRLLTIRSRWQCPRDGFPHDSTVNQFLDAEHFEAYVMLGRHIGEQLDQFIVDGKLDAHQLPAPWRFARQKSESTEELPGKSELPEAEKTMPANDAAETEEPAADHRKSDKSEQPEVSSELLGPSAVAQLLHPLHFDKPGIGVAIALVRQWAEAEYENDQDLLSAGRDVFDHIIRPVSNWAYEAADADEPQPALRKLFCSQLIEILEEHTWIANEADEEIRNDFRNMLEEFGEGVAGVRRTIASLSPGAERVS